MAQAGLSEIASKVIEIELTPPNGVRGAAVAAVAASRVGPAARIVMVKQGKDSDAQAIEDSVAQAFGQFEFGGEVRVPATVNLFTCRASTQTAT